MRRSSLGFAVALVGLASACSPPPSTPAFADLGPEEGGILAELQLSPGATLSSVSWTVTGPAALTRTGTIALANSTTVSALVGPFPAGSGYSITLAGTASDASTCGGSATFAVTAHQTTAVPVHLTCREAHRLGGVLIMGAFNVCPVIDSVSTPPPSLAVGTALGVIANAHDPDVQPMPIQYHWAATSGTFSDVSLQAPSFRCTVPGPAILTVTVGDGDATPGCSDVAMLTIDCVP